VQCIQQVDITKDPDMWLNQLISGNHRLASGTTTVHVVDTTWVVVGLLADIIAVGDTEEMRV